MVRLIAALSTLGGSLHGSYQLTSLPAGKEVDSNNPAHKVQQYLTIAGLLLTDSYQYW